MSLLGIIVKGRVEFWLKFMQDYFHIPAINYKVISSKDNYNNPERN